MQRTIKVMVGFLWMLVIGYYYYFQNHSYYLDSFTFLNRIAVGLISAGVSIGMIIGAQILWNYFKKKKLFEFKLSLWKGLVSILIITMGILVGYQLEADIALYEGGTLFQDSGNSWGMLPEGGVLESGMNVIIQDNAVAGNSSDLIDILPPEIQANFTEANLIDTVVFTGGNIIVNMLALLLLTLASYSIGHRLLRFTGIGNGWSNIPKSLSEFLFSIGIGLSVYMGFVFVLGLLGIAKVEIVLAGLGFLTAISWKEVLGLIKVAIKNSISLELNPKSFSMWTVLTAVIIFGYNLLSIVRPMPLGWDDSNHYLYISKKIADTGSLLDGAGGMYNWELVNTISSYTGNAMLPLFTNFWGGILAMAAIYMFLKVFMKKEMAVTLTSFFYIIPSVIFQSATDLKNDLPLVFFVLLGAYAFVHWLKNEKASWLYLTGVLLGIGIGIKITAGIALILIVVVVAAKLTNKKGGLAMALTILGLALLVVDNGQMFNIPTVVTQVTGVILVAGGFITGFLALSEKRPTAKHLKTVFISTAIVFAMLTPWVIKNTLIDGMGLNINNYHAAKADMVAIDTSLVGTCEESQLDNEFADYIVGRGDRAGEVSFVSLPEMPWQMTMNPGFTGIYIDITFVFLGLIPLMLWYRIEKKDKTYAAVAALSVLYFIILIFFFDGVAWYGYAGFCLLLVLIGRATEKYKEEGWREGKALSLLPEIAIGITLISVVLMQAASFGEINNLAYLSHIIDSDKYIGTVNPGVLDTAKYLEENEEGEITIYRIGGATSYYLTKTNSKFVYDEALNIFDCMKNNYTDAEIVNLLNEIGIDYIAFDYTYAIEANATDIVRNRYFDLYEFGHNNMEIIVEEGDYILFKVPDPV